MLPNADLFAFLDAFALVDDAAAGGGNRWYTVNADVYKRVTPHLPAFLEKCKAVYPASQQFYLTRPMTYSRLLTVLRQICNRNKVAYTTRATYLKSEYWPEMRIARGAAAAAAATSG